LRVPTLRNLAREILGNRTHPWPMRAATRRTDMAFYFLVSLVGCIWAAAIASNKNLNVAVYAIVGFLFPLIGVLVAYGAAKQEPKEAAP
jgi:hypothetical protein